MTVLANRYGSSLQFQILEIEIIALTRMGTLLGVLSVGIQVLASHLSKPHAVREFRDICETDDHLRPVQYSNKPPFIMDYPVLSEAANILTFLAHKSEHWAYEGEWRLIVELNATIGTGHRDAHDQSINLLQIPNRAVSKVFLTETTPRKAVDEVRKRLEDGNNRYRAKHLTKLVLSEMEYAYVEADAVEQV